MYTVKTLGCTCPPNANVCACVRHAIMIDGKEIVAIGKNDGLINQIVNAANTGMEYIERETRKALLGELDNDDQG